MQRDLIYEGAVTNISTIQNYASYYFRFPSRFEGEWNGF